MTVVIAVKTFVDILANESIARKTALACARVFVLFVLTDCVSITDRVLGQSTEVYDPAILAVAFVANLTGAFIRSFSIGTICVFVAQVIQAQLALVDVETNFAVSVESFPTLTFTSALSWNADSKLVALTVSLTEMMN